MCDHVIRTSFHLAPRIINKVAPVDNRYRKCHYWLDRKPLVYIPCRNSSILFTSVIKGSTFFCMQCNFQFLRTHPYLDDVLSRHDRQMIAITSSRMPCFPIDSLINERPDIWAWETVGVLVLCGAGLSVLISLLGVSPDSLQVTESSVETNFELATTVLSTGSMLLPW